MSGFVVLALPRSRTFWLSRFLTYGDFVCGHEQARYVRGLDDIRAWLSMEFAGTAETSIARFWRLIPMLSPTTKLAVIRRDPDQVVESLMQIDLGGVCALDRQALHREVGRLDRALDQLERSDAGAMSVAFDDLRNEETCARLFEHLLPYKHDRSWWQSLVGLNLQTNMRALMRYAIAHRAAGAAGARTIRRQVRLSLARQRAPWDGGEDRGVRIQTEGLDTFWRDATDLMRRHCEEVGEPPDQFERKNLPLIAALEDRGAWNIMTARRTDGTMVGYLISLVGPSLEAERTAATQTAFFVAPEESAARIGMRLLHAAVAWARSRGVSEIMMRAGVRGSGPRLGVLYRRLGAKPDGTFYRLTLGKV